MANGINDALGVLNGGLHSSGGGSNEDNPAGVEKIQRERKKICDFCHQENSQAKICSRCRLVNYCNEKCQREAWKTHKLICKEPIETTLTIESRDFSHGTTKSKEIPFRIHDPEDAKQKYARPTGMGAIKQRHFEGIEGNNLNYVLKNLVSFVSDFSANPEETIKQLNSQGYSGLISVAEEKLASLLKEENYFEILKHVWTEKNYDFKLQWLRTQALKGHVILMYETARALAHSKMNKEKLLEAYKWRTLGRIHTFIDAVCYDDNSVHAAVDDLQVSYSLEHLLSSFSEKSRNKILDKIKRLTHQIYEVRLQEIDPSPRWLMNFGINSFLGTNTLKPQEQWMELKQKKLQDMIAFLEES